VASASTFAPAPFYNGPVTRFVRFRSASADAYGILHGDTIHEIAGGLFGTHEQTGAVHALSSVKLLAPCEPTKILGVGLNYRSHLSGRPQPAQPEIFFKAVTSLQNPGDPIEIPRDATDVHYEGELVVAIGKPVKRASVEEARDAIFGVTCGNDVSERNWQHGAGKDLQWWRAKGSDTFAPLGPAIATGLDYSNLLLQTRLNGEVVQRQHTADLIFDCAAIVSRVSGWVTLLPGDLIYTGTPGSTRKLTPGDVVEVEIEGIGVLINPVV
jgi:2-keto-4-pentenoate hydratase/2-oxohepta-3-ene-1,7-dioic acid hydratase in catechol pathway